MEDFFDSSEKENEILREIAEVIKKRGIKLPFGYYISNPSTLLDVIREINRYFETYDVNGNYIKTTYYKEICYSLLDDYGYFTNNDIKLALKMVQSSNDKDYQISRVTFKSWIMEGYRGVKEFELDGQYIYITDESGYTYTLIDLNSYDMQNDELNIARIKELIPNGGKNDCHNYTEQIAMLIPEGKTITSALPRFMVGNYYLHSYSEYNGYIIDLTLNIMIKKEDYYRLMKPIELSKIENYNLLSTKQEIENKIGDLDKLNRASWSYIVYAAFLNIKDNRELLYSLFEDNRTTIENLLSTVKR